MGSFSGYFNFMRSLENFEAAFRKGSKESSKEVAKNRLDIGYDKHKIKFSSVLGSGLTLTNNGMEYSIKVIRTLQNRTILLKRAKEKVMNQKGGFLGPLIRVGLPLMKNEVSPSAKSVLIPLE